MIRLFYDYFLKVFLTAKYKYSKILAIGILGVHKKQVKLIFIF